ncbi:FabD/lysophospholipase-like protein [Penicillium lividum]|nr:FabD/lysophospholipase-like protein [Penicillium lividum]
MTDSDEPLRILLLDGGGIRGISSLLILERIMQKIGDAKGLSDVPRPCDYFDLIGGTSTGGIIAILLGRLGLTVDECITAYRKVAKQTFTPKRTSFLPAAPKGAFSEKSLEDSIKEIVREYCTDIYCVTRRREGHATVKTCPHSDLAFRDHGCKKTRVSTQSTDNIDAPPTLFTTYDSSAAFASSTLWQVARATSAATTFFKSIKVGRDQIEFIDAAFGYNNPSEIMIQEDQREFPGRTIRILSLGTGLGDVVAIKNTQLSILTALKNMATSSKRVAANMDSRFGDSGEYHRFNAVHGLQDITLSDWEEASTISAHTYNYLNESERALQKFVDDFTHQPQNSELGSEVIKQGKMITIHLATQTWVEQEGTTNESIETAIPHMQAVFPSNDYTNREVSRTILPHGLKILRICDQYDLEDIPWLYYNIGNCLQADGRIKEAVYCFEEYVRWTRCRYEEDDPHQLASQHHLTGVYQDDGQTSKALELLEYVVLIGKALALLEYVVSVGERTLAQEHPDRLASQYVLARVYEADGQIGKAIELLEHVVAVE